MFISITTQCKLLCPQNLLLLFSVICGKNGEAKRQEFKNWLGKERRQERETSKAKLIESNTTVRCQCKTKTVSTPHESNAKFLATYLLILDLVIL